MQRQRGRNKRVCHVVPAKSVKYIDRYAADIGWGQTLKGFGHEDKDTLGVQI